MEIWDLFGEKRQPLHRTHRRGEMMNFGEYHIDVEIWTVDSNRNILITLRDSTKQYYPSKWEATGGSVLSGETSRQAAIRELKEETGILAVEDELSFLGTCQEIEAFVDIYLLRCDIPISKLIMQPGETVDAKWISFEQLEEMIADESLALPIGEHFQTVKQNFYDKLGHNKT
ncbi:NUDIX hydrolase [Scatolibacter rhodanostii]|uniref:NUDIX hydrolase n=1 Tax=Scatolibacter rhodanostii TaxID=2014781 RepID=UPI000C08A58C|nr:NUDIX domain-containing protein [Scatolibacter rhodanostii]